MQGMGEGPYSRDGFLRGWNFGNAFAVRSVLTRSPDAEVMSMPAAELRAAWEWNERSAEQRNQLRHRGFVPTIAFFRIHERPSRVLAWGEGMPIVLPRVDYVFVGRLVAGERRYGLAPWSEILDVASRAGFDTSKEPLEFVYLVAPPLVAEWAARVPLVDIEDYERLHPYKIIDDELIASAREGIERDRSNPDGTWTIS